MQVRLELGLLQLELDGRPDGLKPEGNESWLEVYRQRQQQHESQHPDGAPFQLEPEDCERLLREGIQYYHRYLGFWHLRRYELCARDTNRNLRLFKFVREHARLEQDRRQFDQYRPYVTMMHTRAVATPLVEMNDFTTALGAIDAGIRAIRDFLEEYRQTERASRCTELTYLEGWRAEVAASLPDPQPAPAEPNDLIAQLSTQLSVAIAQERFEEAAHLRDEIRRLSASPFRSEGDEKL